MKKIRKYVELANRLKEQIEAGLWKENTATPTERQISESYDVSRSTVRKAIQMMTEEGYLRSEQGSGTFVRPSNSRDNQRSLHSLSDDLESKGLSIGQIILDLEVIEPNKFIRDKLSIHGTDDRVQKIRRVRLSGTTPIGIHTAYIPLNGHKPITEVELMNSQSLYRLLNQNWGIKPVEAVESLSARLPSPQESQYLEITMNEAVLICNRISYSSKDQPIEYVEMVYPSSRFDYTIRINSRSYYQ
ncbi:GntR family transcriptional regulator [Vibrio pomeroyi]|uniref:GntR family transcriptional regulator n=1 Tax=Vibrio TaxID=662 RepID=UPI0035A67F93